MMALSALLLAAATPTAACPAPFPRFLDRFRRDLAFQKAHTAPVLTMTHVDPAAEPEPATVSRKVAHARIDWPVIAGAGHMAREVMQQTIARPDGATPNVLVRKPDSDFQIRYRFRRVGSCWQLVRIDDETL